MVTLHNTKLHLYLYCCNVNIRLKNNVLFLIYCFIYYIVYSLMPACVFDLYTLMPIQIFMGLIPCQSLDCSAEVGQLSYPIIDN